MSFDLWFSVHRISSVLCLMKRRLISTEDGKCSLSDLRSFPFGPWVARKYTGDTAARFFGGFRCGGVNAIARRIAASVPMPL